MMLAMLGGIAGITGIALTVGTQAAGAASCPSGTTLYSATSGLKDNNYPGDYLVYAGSGPYYPIMANAAAESFSLCYAVTVSCTPACDQGNVYLFNNHISEWVNSQTDGTCCRILNYDATTPEEFTFACTGAHGWFNLFDPLNSSDQVGSQANEFGDGSGGGWTTDTLNQPISSGFCW